MSFLSTGQVAELLQVNLHRLEYLTRDRQIRPAKGPTGAFLWTYAHVSLAAHLLKVKGPSREEYQQIVNRNFQR